MELTAHYNTAKRLLVITQSGKIIGGYAGPIAAIKWEYVKKLAGVSSNNNFQFSIINFQFSI